MCRQFLQQLWWAILGAWLHPLKWRSSIRECNCREAELSVWHISAKWWERKQEDEIGDVTGKLLNIDKLIFMYTFFYVVYWHINIHVPGVSMWFYSIVSWKDPTVHSTCRYGMVARWAIQNMLRHLPSRNNTISGWLYEKLHPTTTKWNSKSILSLRVGEHNGAYHVLTWAR